MTVRITTLVPGLTSRYGNPTLDCGSAQLRAQCRHLATVVTIEGDINVVNVGPIGEYIRRFILAKHHVVLDLSGVDAFDAPCVSLLYVLDEASRAAGVEWTLVAGQAVSERIGDHDEAVFPIARSAQEALSYLADVIVRRREMLLPLFDKTA